MPRLQIKDSGGTMRTIRRLSIMDGTGTLRLLQTLNIKDDTGTLRLVYQYFTAATDTDTISGADTSGGTISITTFDVTVTPTGGTAPFTYLWSQVSTDGSLWSIDFPTAAVTSFTGYAVGPGDFHTAVFQCVVTDANGSTAATGQVTASVTNFGS